jgi:hypothetical protein
MIGICTVISTTRFRRLFSSSSAPKCRASFDFHSPKLTHSLVVDRPTYLVTSTNRLHRVHLSFLRYCGDLVLVNRLRFTSFCSFFS